MVVPRKVTTTALVLSGPENKVMMDLEKRLFVSKRSILGDDDVAKYSNESWVKHHPYWRAQADGRIKALSSNNINKIHGSNQTCTLLLLLRNTVRIY
jgi:hypothetical protein